ncbi:hypothetical protein [Runella aurantiaca]|uniref:Uncharacterized protein n=1 Tax=Runella aurantiaca TaxID=2282308 RepID=A0A369IDN4_9BACT|nr:hypothetical protein [Runella aurantiaca]RDB06375.1 hypothetical protein DVG78_08935 [Runella aurantiaca]
MEYNETDFVQYALQQMEIPVLKRNGKYFELAGGFLLEVEDRNLYRLSIDQWVISPFDDIGTLCNFIKANLNVSYE